MVLAVRNRGGIRPALILSFPGGGFDMHKAHLIGCALGLLLLSGCTKVKVELERDLPLGEPKELLLGPYKGDQKLVVTATPIGTAVDIYMFLEEDRDTAMKAAYAKGADKLLIVERMLESEARYEVTVPAGKEAVVYYLANKKSGSIKLKINSL